MSANDETVRQLAAVDVTCTRNVNLARKSFIKAGGIADLLIEPANRSQLETVVRLLTERGAAFRTFGNLSNVLFRDGTIQTPLISTAKMRAFELSGEGELYAEAGVSLTKVARAVTSEGFLGFSGLSGFPATVGGAVVMNASCYGDAVSDFLTRVECLDPTGRPTVLARSDLDLGWRHSAFHSLFRDYVILGAHFTLSRGNGENLQAHLRKAKENRVEYQEHKLPNLGSTFATRDIYAELYRSTPAYRPGVILIKAYVRALGRRGPRVWAELINRYSQRFFHLSATPAVGFSRFTFNCVVNRDNASASEIIEFIRMVQRRIRNCVPLEIEIIDGID